MRLKIDFRPRDCDKLEDFCGWRIWEKPKFNSVYAIGADVSEGVNRDASAAQVIDVTKGLHVASFWSNQIDLDNYAAELYKGGNFYNKAYICIEQNNHGHAIIALMGGAVGSLAYPNLYKRIEYDEFVQKPTKKIGFKTTVSTKPRIIENLKVALRDGELNTFDKETILEISNFVRDTKSGRMGANGTAQDDRVMALALAWEEARILKENMKQTTNRPWDQPAQRYDSVTGFPM